MAGSMPCACVHGVGGQYAGLSVPRRPMKPTAGRLTYKQATSRPTTCGCGRRNERSNASRAATPLTSQRTQHSALSRHSVACQALPVSEMKVLELKDELRDRGYPISGNKAALQERLLQALQEEEQRGNASQQQPDASPDPPATPPSPSQHSDAPVSFYEQPQLDKKYQQQPQTQLDAAQLAASQGSDTESVEGAQYQAASAAAAPSEGLSPATTPVEPAALPSTAPPSEQLTDGSDALSDPAGQDSQPVEAGGHGSSKSGWASLTAERLRTQLRHRGLRTGGLKPALIQRIIDAVGPEVIELTEPMPSPVDYTTVGASDADTGADAAPEASSSDVGDLSSYKASELKKELNRLGLPSTGSRQALENRLMDHYQSTEDSQLDQLAEQVEGMSAAELQQELLARGQSIQGLTKLELQDLLWHAVQAEAGLLPPQDQGQGVTDGELQEQLQFSSLEAAPQVQDPPLMVALLCGGPLAGQAQSLTSAQMLLQQLQTHNPREGFQGDPAASAASSPSPADPANPSSSSSSDQSETASSLSVSPSLPTAKRDDLTGIHFVPIFITSEGHAMPITAAELCGKSGATLQFEAGLNGRQIVNLEQLGLQLQGVADVALSTVQGSGAHVIQEAVQAVGMPVVGPTSQVHDTVSHRMRRQTELAQLGYPVLPMCQLSKSLFASHDTTINQTPATLSEGTSSPEDAIGPEGSAAQQGMEEEDSWQEEDQEGMSDQASTPGWQAEFERWLNEHSFSFDDTTFVLKPAGAGAGEDVWLINNLEMLQRRAQHIFSQGLSDSIVVEQYCPPKEYTEFGVTVLGTAMGPVALLPTEIASFDMSDDIAEADLDNEAYQARLEGYDQQVIDVMLDAYRQEQLVNTSDVLDQPLISPFQPDQPFQRELRYHSPPRFSKEVVEGIRHAAGRLFKDLGLQDIACIRGWVKTDLPAQLTALSPSSSPPKKILTSPVVSATAASDSSVTSRPELAQPVESLPFDLDNFHISPRANLAVPSLNTPSEDDGGYDIYEALEPNAEPDSSTVTLAEPHSAEAASANIKSEQSLAESTEGSGLGDLDVDGVNTVAGIVSDSEDDDEDLLSTLFYNEDPAELCRHGSSTIMFSGVDAVPSLHPTSLAFQQAADVGMSHSALLRQVLSSACQRAGLPAIPSIPPQDITSTALVPYGQVRGEGHEGLVDFGAAALEQPRSVYAPPPYLFGPTPSGRVETMRLPEAEMAQASPWDPQGTPAGGQFGQQWDEQQYGSMQPSYPYNNGVDYAQGYDAEPGYGQAGYAAVPAGPSKVWVLLGGEGAQRQTSLKSGLHVWLMLQNNPELQVEPFLLAPLGSNLRERARRKDLLRQRNTSLQLGVAEHELDDPLQLPNIRNPDPPQHSLPGRGLWAVPHALLLRDTVEQAQAACEMALAPVNAVHRTLSETDRNVTELRQAVQQMLQYAQVEGAGSMWGYDNSMMQQPPPPRYMDLQSFAEEARSEGAVVLNTVQAEIGDDGLLQSFLEDADVQVAHTGSDALASKLCHDKIAMSNHLKTLEVYHISTIPKRRLTRDQLLAVLQDEQAVENLFQDLRTSLGDSPELCVKPAMGGLLPQQPLPCLASSTDLWLFGLALQERYHQLPADYLSTLHAAIPLPPASTQDYMVEPYIHSARLVSRGGEPGGPQEVVWEGDSRWIPISAALLGEVGRMQVLTPSVLVHPTDEDSSQGQAVQITPPPVEFLPSDVIDSAKHWMTLAADRLAIAGAAQMDVLVHADKGEIIIVDVHTVPDLSQDSLLLQQALVEDPPVHPVDVLREIIDLGQLPLQPAYEAGDPQEGFTSSETDDSLDATELDQDLLAEGSSQLQNVEQAMDASQPIQPARGNATEAAGWTDDSFTDAAIDDSDFDAGFDIVEQNQYL